MEMENLQQQVNQGDNFDQNTPSANPISNQRGNFLFIIGIVVLVIIIGAGGYFLSQKQAKPDTVPQQVSQPTSSPTSDEIADWKVYSSDKLRFSFSYPAGATLYENKVASTDGVFVDSPDSIQLILPVSCGQGMFDNSLLTVAVSKDQNSNSFGSPNVFSSDIEKKEIVIAGSNAFETTKGVPGLYGSDQIGIKKEDLFYLIKGEPCLTNESRKILSTFKFISQ